ncbi:GNAT family N-acetyltransferase [Fusibacter bizertensis]|uniref:GNAT family N-acetyltransferase n=1 Tax=Fusibacter bizertensis TaxID=1488331 RepID=A0ABT6NH30_9FIRM|nr:GNAT family N-acetyltransferase [Fusibacter bizertensis]MDH8679739.1 GNAT family N-acetyltransferase [Fusibacter bizertensis]
MNYSKVSLEDSDIEQILLKLSKWHNLTPKIWTENYVASDEDIKETIERIKSTKNSDLFLGIARDEDDITGFIWGQKQENPENSVMIQSLYVEKRYRNIGVASKLKKNFEVWCQSEGINSIVTTVHYKNKNMLELNRKLGYEPGMVYMRKKLKSK